MTPEDPGLWKQISSWLWAILAIPVAALWRKVDAAASKQDLKDAMDACEAANETLRTSTVKLFENAEQDRRRFEERFSKMQDMIHGIHVEVLLKLGDKK
jgi:hypothetical protein